MECCYFIGIDIAEDTLGWAVYTQQDAQLSTHETNTLTGIKTALSDLRVPPGWDTKQAGGMQRGKTARLPGNKVDALYVRRAASYRFRDQIRIWELPRKVMQKLTFLSAIRQRLNQAYNLLAVPVTEQETFISRSLQKSLKGNVKKSLLALKEEQKAVEQSIKQLSEADIRLKECLTR